LQREKEIRKNPIFSHHSYWGGRYLACVRCDIYGNYISVSHSCTITGEIRAFYETKSFYLHNSAILNVLEADIRITLIFSPKSVDCDLRIRYPDENRDI
tara:strand:+ start:73 stop:369 length:297 start_codon:yes stop_codon:yes gene_type:complete